MAGNVTTANVGGRLKVVSEEKPGEVVYDDFYHRMRREIAPTPLLINTFVHRPMAVAAWHASCHPIS